MLDGSALFGYNHATTKRDVDFVSQEANGTTDGYGVGLDSGIGYRVDLDDDTTVTPRLGLDYTYDHENGYTETGAPGANLAIASGDQNLLESSIGATFATKISLPERDGTLDTLRPQLTVAWQHDVLNPSASVNEAFAGVADSSFTAVSANPGRDAANVGLGLNLTPHDMPTVAFYVRYDGSFSANETADAVTVGGKFAV